MRRLLWIVVRALVVVAGVIAVVYVCEDMLLRYRANHGGTDAVFDNVTTYEAGAVKGGKEEFYFDQPHVEVCVRALFPHFGNAPCWYVRRHTVQLLSREGREAPHGDAGRQRAIQGARNSKLDVILMPGESERYTGHFGANMPCTRSTVSRLSTGAAITNAT